MLIAAIYWPTATAAELEAFADDCDARAAHLVSKPGYSLAAQVRRDAATQARQMRNNFGSRGGQ